MDSGLAHDREREPPPRPFEPQSSPPSPAKQSHRRQRSQTIGTTFVSTTVVPAPSSTDVLSSLISSLTVLSDSAREQIRTAREFRPSLSNPSLAPTDFGGLSTVAVHDEAHQSHVHHSGVFDVSDGEEAAPPVVGYTKSRSRDQRTSSQRERWNSHGSMKEKAFTLGRSGSSHTLRRPTSGASSGIGVPSIERGHSGSSSSLAVSASGTKSPLKMLFSTRHDDELAQPSSNYSREAETKSIKSIKSMRSRHSTRISQDQDKETYVPEPVPEPVPESVPELIPIEPVPVPMEPQSPPQPVGKHTPEPKLYSPLSPANRDDLSEYLIPSRRSSMRHSPTLRESSKGRSPSVGRLSLRHPKSLSSVDPDMANSASQEQLLEEEEEDSTLKRIRELQQAKEKRQSEWRRESRRPDRAVRQPSHSGAQPREDGASGTDLMAESPVQSETTMPEQVQQNETHELVQSPSPALRGIGISSPPPSLTPAMPSPALSTPRKHKRSLSTGLRRSNSSKHRPVDDLRTVSERVEALLNAPKLTQRIRHPRTGRTIAFSEVGDPQGFPVLCCVGMGLTRYVTSFYDDVARTQKLRLITPDRPGIGESSPFPDNYSTPLAWADDVAVICQALNLDQFSLLAHSAGAIYALATALKMPDMVRGRIHLLAPWIPPSQFPHGHANGEVRAANLPMAHKLLSVLPSPFLKAANSRFLSATSASIDARSGGKGWKKDRSIASNYDALLAEMAADMQPANLAAAAAAADPGSPRHSSLSIYSNMPASTPPPYSNFHGFATPPASPSPSNLQRRLSNSAKKLRSPTPNEGFVGLTPQARQALFNSELTHRTWALATQHANPAVDLLVCLERRRPIGFKYVDVHREVVIHHGRKDGRVPLDNVQWLSEAMKRCELRILNEEGHGLMASAGVMSRVLAEIGREWEEWDIVAKDNERKRKAEELERAKIKEAERRRYIRQGH